MQAVSSCKSEACSSKDHQWSEKQPVSFAPESKRNSVWLQKASADLLQQVAAVRASRGLHAPTFQVPAPAELRYLAKRYCRRCPEFEFQI